MKLVIFDIDGTIIDSVQSDDACFVQSFKDLFNLDLHGLDWGQFKNITDSGLTNDIFLKYFNRPPLNREILNLKEHYYNLLTEQIGAITEIEGAHEFVNYLEQEPSYTMAFATGGWEMTALLKSGASNVDIRKYTYKTADDHFNRAQMLQLAIDDSLRLHGVTEFESITSIGDGMWDKTTAEELGVEFIGVDYHQNGKLKETGVSRVIRDYRNTEEILKWL